MTKEQIQKEIRDMEKRLQHLKEQVEAIYGDNVKEDDDDYNIISGIFLELGVPSHIVGYKYLMEAIAICLNSKECLMIQKVYKQIADKYNSTSSRVERGIRYLIEVIYWTGNVNRLNEIFGYTERRMTGRPTNKEFIYGMVRWLRK